LRRAISPSSTNDRSGERRHSDEGDLQECRQRLWPGLSVSTRLLVETLKQVIVVPEDAVQRGPNGLYALCRRQ
jgi:multidrug efflux system membrane fusion protein